MEREEKIAQLQEEVSHLTHTINFDSVKSMHSDLTAPAKIITGVTMMGQGCPGFKNPVQCVSGISAVGHAIGSEVYNHFQEQQLPNQLKKLEEKKKALEDLKQGR